MNIHTFAYIHIHEHAHTYVYAQNMIKSRRSIRRNKGLLLGKQNIERNKQ